MTISSIGGEIMHIPVDILSTMTTRTDSGSGVKQRTGSGIEQQGSRFERMFENELSKYESRITDKSLNEDNGKELKPIEAIDEEDNTEEALAAGVMGNLQSNVVFILEGDKASAENPALQALTEVEPETNQIVNPEINNETKQETITTDSQEFSKVLGATTAEATMTKTETSTNEVNNATTSDEVMARMPEIRTQDSQENGEKFSKSSENGNLSPLENENDTSKVNGQKDKTYQEAADAVKGVLENKPEQIISTNEIAPPISEGIKTEQFQATQQMTQATLNTPVKPENLFQEMIDRVELMQSETKSTMTIQLNPEFLGKVALEVAVDAAGLHVKINAEDSGVRSMINGQLATLLESLENKGLAIAEVEVVYTGVNNGAFKEPGANEQQQQSRQYKPTNRDVNALDGVAYYTNLADLQDYYFETGVSSVEFSA